MRGSLFWFAAASQRSGIIPAHAGLTISGTGYRGYRRDHPRACGAHHCTLLVYISMQGSSPRMRGSPAGEWYESRCRQDHPRACGAHPMNQTIVNNIKGSSPRMRGSRHSKDASLLPEGIIPAHAGLTLCSTRFIIGQRDHPRACGAHLAERMGYKAVGGSSPRMRGSHNRHTTRSSGPGIIPAHAGLTWKHAPDTVERGDHPRACGAHVDYILSIIEKEGSSPRMRGSQAEWSVLKIQHGIIPAHAGLTRNQEGYTKCQWIIPAHAGLTNRDGATSPLKRDHPRACGAHRIRSSCIVLQ